MAQFSAAYQTEIKVRNNRSLRRLYGEIEMEIASPVNPDTSLDIDRKQQMEKAHVVRIKVMLGLSQMSACHRACNGS